MLDTFEIITTSGVVLWSRTYAAVSPAVVNNFIVDVFIEEKSAVAGAGAKDSSSAATNPPYKNDQHTLRWAFVKELGIIFVAVYRSLLHLSWIDKLVDNIKSIFVSLYGDQLKKPNTTIVECLRFDEYFDQQLQELETAASKSDRKDLRAFEDLSVSTPETPPSPPALRTRAQDVVSDSSPTATPIASRPSTPGAGASHLVVAKGGPMAKMSRRARKAQNTNSAPFSSGDEGSARRSKASKPVKKGRKWDADGLADEEDDVQLDYSTPAAAVTSDNEAEPGRRTAGVEAVDALTWGSTTIKGKFVLRDLGDEVHSILASAEAKTSTSKTDAPSGLVGSGLSAIGGLFRNVVGGKVLTKEDLDKTMKGMEEHLLKKNVAREAAVRLCEGVEKELVGLKTGNFESTSARIQKAMEASLTKMLTPTSSLDLLREIDAITAPPATSLRKPRPYVMSIVGVNGVGKSTNLSKICFFLLQNKYKVLIAAGDTFRSGAVEQLAVHVRNLKELTAREGGKVELYQKGYGKDAAAVAKDAVAFAAQEGFDVVLIDTAGRRHNDQRLMSSLEKFAKFAQPDKILMVGEALVGTDSVAQARNFNAAFGSGRSLDGFIISKCDTVGDMVGTLNYGNMAKPGQYGFATNTAGEGEAPPSTLAARLVENISTSSRPSRPDDVSELKRLSTIIERVKNNPAILETDEQRLEHNHLLIYVCGGVVFESLKWEEPFEDRVKLRDEALKAISFLNVTIRETPKVLTCTTDGKTFASRGKEPLWLWILPKVLRLLGYSKSLALTSAIESLFQHIIFLTMRNGSLWELGTSLLQYFQTNLAAILRRLEATRYDTLDSLVNIQLPPRPFLDTFPEVTPKKCSYVLKDLEQAVRHATGLVTIIKGAVIGRTGPEPHSSLFFSHYSSLLCESLHPLLSLQALWPAYIDVGIASTVQAALDIATAQRNPEKQGFTSIQRANTVLAILCSDLLESPRLLLSDEDSGPALRRVICLALVHLAKEAVGSRSLSTLISYRLVPHVAKLASEAPAEHADLLKSMGLVAQFGISPPPKSLDEQFRPDKFVDEALRLQVMNLGLESNDPQQNQPDQPVAKKRKITQETSTLSFLIARLCRIINVTPPRDSRAIAELEPQFIAEFPTMSPEQQCNTLDLLSRVCCSADGALRLRQKGPGTTVQLECLFCSKSESMARPKCADRAARDRATSIFIAIIRSPGFQKLKRPRVFAMVALRRLAKHSPSIGFLDFETSFPGQWCLDCLRSSIRELRVAAGRTFGIYFLDRPNNGLDKNLVRGKRKNALEFLKTLSEKDTMHLHEACILAWGQVGRVIDDDDLGLVLLGLVEYLGHRNTIVSAWAFSEIMNVAEARGVTPKRLFQPYWSSLAFSVLKDLVSKPQTASKLAELLQIPGGVPELLLLLQRPALPWLVLKKKRDVIQKIAEARGEAIFGPCLDTVNLSCILALIFVQDVEKPEDFAMTLLRNIGPEFGNFELVELLRSDPLLIALELFKVAADGDETRRARAKAALAMVGGLLAEPDPKDKKNSKTSHIIGRYVEQHALGLVSKLGEVITDSISANPPAQERRQCLRAMEEMIRICRTYVCVARPQISASLMSAMSLDELRSAAFSCWHTMITSMDEADVEALVEMTFFIIGHYWEGFDEDSKARAKSFIRYLIEKHERTLISYSNKLPSLTHIKELRSIYEKVCSLRPALDSRETFAVFAERLNHENPSIVQQALLELAEFLKLNQEYIQISAVSEQPDSVILSLTRSLLDCASKYNGWHPDFSRLCAECIGLIGCLDSNRLETTRKEKDFVLVHNFEDASETTNFVTYLLDNVLVKAFLSTTDMKFQGFLAFAMQELLDKTDIRFAVSKRGVGDSEKVYRKWLSMSESSREILVPFLTSKFVIGPMVYRPVEYPIFRGGTGRSYASWIKALVLDLLHNAQNGFSNILFEYLCRLVRVQDLTVTEALLPFVVLHVVVGTDKSDFRDKIKAELAGILGYQPPESASYIEREDTKLYYEAVFRIIDYFMRWLHAKKSIHPSAQQAERHKTSIELVENLITALDRKLLSKRAVDCKEYARALFFLEPYFEEQQNIPPDEEEHLTQTIQSIYTQVDDPDGLEGISARVMNISLDQQALNHRKAGRWTAAQSWYEIRLAESPSDTNVQLDLLTCLRESGQHDVLLNYVEGMKSTSNSVNRIAPFAVEASWATNRWKTLEKYLRHYNAGDVSEVFDLGIGQALLSLKEGDVPKFKEQVKMLREKVAGSMSYSATSSLRACHDAMLRCHVLSDLEMIVDKPATEDQQSILAALDRRLEVLGAYVGDKQYLLGVRRAAMELMRPKYGNQDISSLWLSSARLARKAGSIHQSFNAVLHAQQLGDASATIENAKLLYKDGHHRKAIQVLQFAIDTDSFINESLATAPPTSSKSSETQRNLLTARAHLLLAKWLDSTGQTHASALRSKYQQAAKTHPQWEKGHYYLGRHYKKVLESEKALKVDDQTDEYLTGETAKLVIENYLRSLNFGTKYLYQTLPRILTLWLELGAQVDKPPDGKVSLSRELQSRRKQILQELHRHFGKHLPKMPAFIFYTALPQIAARIAHPNTDVFRVLEQMIVKVIEAYPRQAIWSLFPFMTTRVNSERRIRGQQILQTVRSIGRKVESTGYDLRQLLRMGEKLAEQLLLACNNGDFQSNRTTTASITRDLNFNHKCTPCPLVVPIQSCLTATLPTLTDNVRKHKAFSRDVITIDSFLDQVLVLGSLAKPRKLTARGSDGQSYGLLIKPKDDLRTDQRLMEFNGLINRSLKRDAESSRRQLYIRTYAVTPLNEECGIIEWVDGLKTLRDILLGLYKARGIAPNYGQIAQLMKEAAASEANISLFTEGVLGQFPGVLPYWFFSQFPNPSAWFAARLRYARSCAVMSMVGTILGLGDRHGENVLLEEGNGGIFHVDFNCLFDKGLTFAQPEKVPFRLTHNMQAAMGIYRYDGPFRHCSELTLRVLRQQEETLMTILEAFIYDPTLDLQRSKKRNQDVIKLNPGSVVDSIRRKVRGLLPGESIPLGVEGQVEELIKQATDPKNLAAMYIGWCPFL
ncbi:hypothetical protein B0T16DRAFT_487236 [Cercophora newfieldiana]|uniref:Serine/threonine-protein kinase MEC1 n=1 Tax=Cercophora newfieldiana TaxID=92897 RepID=A0AA39YNH6_9PEZI|nr:hypothetical protein B0T16DRAFT_487236 [Cercophora newfieldiana]